MINTIPSLALTLSDIRNNILLSDQARGEAMHLLSLAEAELASLGHNLGWQGPTLSEGLGDQHMEILTRIQLYKSAVAPYRKIPAEILGEIFVRCIDIIKVPVNLREAPWCLARVCLKWRHVVMKTPSLWHRVQVDYRINWSHYGLTSTANKILSRCGRLPAFIKIVGIFGSKDSTAFTRVLNDLVTSRSSRLGSVTLKLVINYRAPFLQLPPGSLRFVDTVDLSFQVPGPIYKITTFQDAPKLRCVTLNNQSPYGLLSQLSCSSQLTHVLLREAPVNISEGHLILRHCTQLLECLFFIKPESGSQHNIVGVTEHLNLTSLVLRSRSSMAGFVQSLALPRLLDFEIFREVENMRKPSEWTTVFEEDLTDFFIPFLQQTPNLQRLCIRQIIPESMIETVLRAVPGITTLAIQDGDALSDATLKLVSQGELIPKVNDICCFVIRLNPFLDMIEARGLGPMPCQRFKKIFIDLDTNGGGADYRCRQRVKTLKAAGYNIILRG